MTKPSIPEFATDDGAALSHVQRRLNIMRAYKQPFTKRINQYYRSFRGWQPPRTFPLSDIPRSNINVPYAFASIEQIVPRLVRAIFGSAGSEYFDMVATGSTPQKNAERHKKVLIQQLRVCRFFIEFVMFLKTVAMYGYAAAEIDWLLLEGTRRYNRLKEEWIDQIISDEARRKYGRGMYEEVVEDAVIFEGNRFTALDWDSIYVDPAARYTLHSGRDCVVVAKTTLRDLKSRKGEDGGPFYSNLDQIASKYNRYSQEDSEQDRRMSAIGAARNVHKTPFSQWDTEGEEIELWKYRTRAWEINVANSSTIILRRANPFWHAQFPLVDLCYSYIPNELFGIGAIESFHDLSEALNVMTNMDLDNWSLMINQMFAVSRDADVPHEQLVSRPGGAIYVNGSPDRAIMPIARTSIAGETHQKQSQMRADISLASALTDVHYLGQNSQSRMGSTATGMNLAQQEGNVRFELIVSLTEAMAMAPALEMMAHNNNQYLRVPQFVQLTNDAPPEQVMPEQFWGDFLFQFYGSSRVGQLERKQFNMGNFLRSMGNNPLIMNQFRPRWMAKQLVKIFELGDPKDALVPGPEALLTPDEEHKMMAWGKTVEPTTEEDLYYHITRHAEFATSPTFAEWPPEAQKAMEDHILATADLIRLMEGMRMGQPPIQGDETNAEGAQMRDAYGTGANAQLGNSAGDATSAEAEGRI